MIQSKWGHIPFESSSGSLNSKHKTTKLPFGVGSFTRQGRAHNNLGINNQDALQLIIEDQFIIGVLCDGTTNNHEDIVNTYSKNEFGSILLSHVVSYLCAENIAPRKNKMNRIKFLQWLSERTVNSIDKTVKMLRIPEEDIIATRQNLLSATIIGFIIRPKEYFVFHCGDGFITINNSIIELNTDYPLRYTNNRRKTMFQECAYGVPSDLHSLGIFSDGFTSEIISSFAMKELLNIPFHHNGYQDLIPDFHLGVLNSLDDHTINSWPHDDASAIILKKSTHHAQNR